MENLVIRATNAPAPPMNSSPAAHAPTPSGHLVSLRFPFFPPLPRLSYLFSIFPFLSSFHLGIITSERVSGIGMDCQRETAVVLYT